MRPFGEHLYARPTDAQLPVRDAREPVRVLIASLALGGAERIVLDWLGAEAARGRACELAVLHAREHAWQPPRGVTCHVRKRLKPADFLRAAARHWQAARAPISCHLLPDEQLRILWDAGLTTAPVVHNAREGWRNDPACWTPEHVPLAVACADAVANAARAHGCVAPLATIRHWPSVSDAAFDPAERARVRAELGIGPDTLLIGAVGAIKAQKHYARAVAVLAAVRKHRDAALVIAGGMLNREGLGELDALIQAALDAGVPAHLRLPGFVDPIEPWLAACDALLNVSRFEGLSIAVREALQAGLPVVATAVSGQVETRHPALKLVAPDATAAHIAAQIAPLPIRSELARVSQTRAPRVWSLSLCHRAPRGEPVDTLFVTANLNAGGAQRSLVNLLCALQGAHRYALAVCQPHTHDAFADELRTAGVEAFLAAQTPDAFALAESVLAHAAARRARTLCLWNVDAKVKLLLARFAPAGLRLIDVSPGHYAFLELEAAREFGRAVDASPEDFCQRLDALVLKYRAAQAPACKDVRVVPNGVAERVTAPAPLVATPRFVVSGRIAPSKRIELILAAFREVIAQVPAAQLHLVGQAEPRHAAYLDHLCERHGDLPLYWRGALPALDFLAEPFHAAVVLGTHQGLPNAVLEAMSAGIPVIANDSGGTHELVRDGETGWLLTEDCTAEELAGAMLDAARSPTRCSEFGAAGRAFVRTHHSMATMCAAYLALLAVPAV